MGNQITIIEAFTVSAATIVLLLMYLTIKDEIKNKKK